MPVIRDGNGYKPTGFTHPKSMPVKKNRPIKKPATRHRHDFAPKPVPARVSGDRAGVARAREARGLAALERSAPASERARDGGVGAAQRASERAAAGELAQGTCAVAAGGARAAQLQQQASDARPGWPASAGCVRSDRARAARWRERAKRSRGARVPMRWRLLDGAKRVGEGRKGLG